MSFIRKHKRSGKIYLEEVESKRIRGRVVQKHIRYIGREADGKTILSSSISNLSIDKVKLHGPLLVLNHLASEIGLSELLGEFGDEILSMVYAHCLDYQSVNQMTRWFEQTDLNMLLDLESLTESRLLNAMDFLESQDATQLQKKIFDSVCEIYKLDKKGIIYDVTNTYLYGKKCPFGKRGKDKEGVKGRPLIQIGLGLTKKEGVPLFHKVFDGNIHDARTLQDMLTMCQEYGIKDGLIVFDRGISSKRNQADIQALRWAVLCGLPMDQGLKKVLTRIKEQDGLLEYRNRIQLNKTVFYVIKAPYRLGSTRGKVIFCFNEQRKKDLRESRYDEIANAQKLLACGNKIKPELERYFGRDGRLLTKKLKAEEEFDGYSCIFTTARLTKKEMVRLYFDKDLVEKAFQSLKGIIKVQPIRHWLYNRVIAHVFICYLSYLLLSLLKYKLTKLAISPITALRELESMYKVYLRDRQKGFQISRVVTLTRIQEKILKAVNKRLLDGCSG